MKVKTHGILEVCIERGIEIALSEFSPCPQNVAALKTSIEREIWLLLDQLLDFDDEFPNT
jgi:hypothetical protein